MKKWIKIVSVLAVVLLSLSVIAGVALAQGPVDEDGDGVCDVCGQASGEGLARGWQFNQDGDARGSGTGWRANGEQPCDDFVDEDGDGVCDDFVDEDGDGVCDNHDEVEPRQSGRGGRGRAGRGMRQNLQNEL
jgi:hypothetical protein